MLMPRAGRTIPAAPSAARHPALRHAGAWLVAVLTAGVSLPASAAPAAVAALAASGAPASPRPGSHETAQAREQARLCERLHGEEGAAACRSALALGIGPARRFAVRQKLAADLVMLEKWEELADLYKEDVRLAPASGAAWERLGRALLFALDRRSEAIAALEQAVRLAPADAESRVTLGLALAAGGRYQDAVAALHEALRLDPKALAGRPAARAVLEAAEQGKPWP